MERIVFLTKEEIKKMIDESPNELIPVTIVKPSGGDAGKLKKVNKKQCYLYVDESKSIICEYGDIFNNVSLYQNMQRDLGRITRAGSVKSLLFVNVGNNKKNKCSSFR